MLTVACPGPTWFCTGEESEVAAGGEPDEPDEPEEPDEPDEPEEGEDEDIDLGMYIDVEPAAQPESGMHALDRWGVGRAVCSKRAFLNIF